MEINPYIEIEKSNYQLIIFQSDLETLDEDDDNVDVQVNFHDGRYYTATFFTPRNVQSLLNKFKQSGEDSSGLYFFCTDMVLLEKLTVKKIDEVVAILIDKDELESAFDYQGKSVEYRKTY